MSRIFEASRVDGGAFRSTTVQARCSCCEVPADCYCQRCGRTYCRSHATKAGLCTECQSEAAQELNRRQGRVLELLAIFGLIFLICIVVGMVVPFADPTRLSGQLLLGLGVLILGLAPVGLLMGRAWLFERAFRRIRKR